jgi:hypothetical protein
LLDRERDTVGILRGGGAVIKRPAVGAEQWFFGFQAQKVIGDDQVAGRGNREELGHAFNHSEDEGIGDAELGGGRGG